MKKKRRLQFFHAPEQIINQIVIYKTDLYLSKSVLKQHCMSYNIDAILLIKGQVNATHLPFPRCRWRGGAVACTLTSQNKNTCSHKIK